MIFTAEVKTSQCRGLYGFSSVNNVLVLFIYVVFSVNVVV